MYDNLIFVAAGAVAACIVFAAIFLYVVWLAQRHVTFVFSGLLWMLTVVSVLGVIQTERFTDDDVYGYVKVPTIESQGISSRIPLMLLIAVSVILCIAWYVRFEKNGSVAMCADGPRGIKLCSLEKAFFCFYGAYCVIPIFFGAKFYFHVSLIYPIFVFLALFLWRKSSIIDGVLAIKCCLSAIVFSSLLSALLFPDFAIQASYSGLIPGFRLRLWGVAASANTLGAVACGMLILEAGWPFKRRTLHGAFLAGAVCALLFTQSKTSIIAAISACAVILVFRIVEKIRYELQQSRGTRCITACWVICIFSFLCIGMGVWIMFGDVEFISRVERVVNGRGFGDVATVSGRTWIWDAAIQAGLESPIFGQGAGMWDEAARHKLGLNGALHAHDLFLQVFSCSGIVGLVTLFLFLFFLVRYAVLEAKSTRGASVAMVIAFFVRSFTEVPLQPNSLLGGETFAFLALIFCVTGSTSAYVGTNFISKCKKGYFSFAPHA